MKKSVSVLLVVLMIFGTIAISASAALCECGNHKFVGKDEYCNCCIACPNIDLNLVFDCAKNENALGEISVDTCCDACVGYSFGVKKCNCVCDCEYCADLNADYDPDEDKSEFGDIITEQDKSDFVSLFQTFLKKISDAFDSFFDTLFGFLGIKSKE